MEIMRPEYALVSIEKLRDWQHRARLLVRDGHRCDATEFADAIWQATTAILKYADVPIEDRYTLTEAGRAALKGGE